MTKSKTKTISLAEALLKQLDKQPIPTGPLVTSDKIFRPFYDIVKFYLDKHGYSEVAKTVVADMAFAFKAEAMSRFGHETVEAHLLGYLLRPKINGTNVGRLDALSHIQRHPRRNMRLDAEQESAADNIKNVWQAFGKGLMIGGRDLSRVGGSGRVLHPCDTMDDELWKHYKEYYQPWHDATNRVPIVRREAGSSVSVASLVFSILVNDVYPDNVDKGYMLTKGTALRVLKKALTNYWTPDKIQQAFRKELRAKDPVRKTAGKQSPRKAKTALGHR
jgi:hypothetical protein